MNLHLNKIHSHMWAEECHLYWYRPFFAAGAGIFIYAYWAVIAISRWIGSTFAENM